jgi:hypothetical protein
VHAHEQVFAAADVAEDERQVLVGKDVGVELAVPRRKDGSCLRPDHPRGDVHLNLRGAT